MAARIIGRRTRPRKAAEGVTIAVPALRARATLVPPTIAAGASVQVPSVRARARLMLPEIGSAPRRTVRKRGRPSQVDWDALFAMAPAVVARSKRAEARWLGRWARAHGFAVTDAALLTQRQRRAGHL